MSKAVLRQELYKVNKYIDQRIKSRKTFSALEQLRKEIIKELNK